MNNLTQKMKRSGFSVLVLLLSISMVSCKKKDTQASVVAKTTYVYVAGSVKVTNGNVT